MKFTELFTKTRREAPKDETSVNAQLLTRGGFIFKNMAGVYSLLPLGVRVIKNIEQIIREEMATIGGQEMHLNIMQDRAVWEKSGRWESAKDVMYQWTDGDKKSYGLGFTHEEVVAQIASQYVNSYKDLPQYLYQIQTKFRNEARAQAGLLRGREFAMKDLYSLTATQEQLDEFYEACAQAYTKIFDRLGLKAIRTKASGGMFSKYSDEFQVVSEVGEDTVFICPDDHEGVNKEVIEDFGKQCSQCKKNLVERQTIEVGNIFKLGTKYSEALGLFFTDADGKRHPVIMGSYGIGIGRAMATVVEVHHDKNGIMWPAKLAPFAVHLIGINKDAKSVYDRFVKKGIEVLYDDRDDASIGQRLADADLIGCPLRVVVSPKTGEELELKHRDKPELAMVSLDKAIDIGQDL